MTWAVLCDFDHTITTEDVTDTLLEAYALPQWRDIEAQWEQGLIGSRACMQQQIALLRASKAQVDAVADSIHVDPHFKNFAAFCEKKGMPLVIVSDGLDYVIEHILARNDIPHALIIASHLEHTGGEHWQLTTPFADSGCSSAASTCKCAMSRQLRQTTGADQIMYIGDGRSDYCVSMQEADIILAKDSLLTYCQEKQLPHRPFTHFLLAQRIAAQLTDLPAQPLPAFTGEQIYA